MAEESLSVHTFETKAPRKLKIPRFLRTRSGIINTVVVLLVVSVIGALSYSTIKKEPQPVAEPTGEQVVGKDFIDTFKPIQAEHVLFFTKAILPERQRTFVQIPYYYEVAEHLEIWLSLQVEPEAESVIVLMDHPIFEEITWPRLDSPSASLYQKNPTFNSVAEFWENPPRTGKILAEPSLAYKERLANLGNVTSMSEDLEWENYDYLITTYRVPIEQDGYKIFETTVDASEGLLDEDQQLFWKLDIPDAGPENRIYMGEIHVDFRLPS